MRSGQLLLTAVLLHGSLFVPSLLLLLLLPRLLLLLLLLLLPLLLLLLLLRWRLLRSRRVKLNFELPLLLLGIEPHRADRRSQHSPYCLLHTPSNNTAEPPCINIRNVCIYIIKA